MRKSVYRFDFDKILAADVFLLVAIGLLFVYSASFYTAKAEGNEFHYLVKQGVGALLGTAVLSVATFCDLKIVRKFAIPLAVAAAVLLALVFVPGLGIDHYGATRWLGFGPFSFQPSEIAKFALVLFAAYFMSKEKVNMTNPLCALPIVGVGATYCCLIIAEPNMSVTVCIALVMLAMLFFGGVKPKYFLLLLIPVCAAVPILIFAEPYRLQRLAAFLDPWASPKAEGYQLIQSLYALGSGGLFGVGIFNSRQKFKFLPFAESDFVFSVIGEETGLAGCVVVFVLFGLFTFRGIRAAVNAKDRFSSFLAGGVTSVVAIQALINFAVVSGSIPPTGLPLPFISYGGTSLVVFMAAAGLLLNVSRTKHNDFVDCHIMNCNRT